MIDYITSCFRNLKNAIKSYFSLDKEISIGYERNIFSNVGKEMNNGRRHG
ncbi:Uncharacterised protein [uncultured archaeon]|nr:Uncharacterised protein [uncultured archaeon]